MGNKDIERLLMNSAEQVEVKKFSERWNDIDKSLLETQDIKLTDSVSETVLATSANCKLSQTSKRKRLIYSISAFFLLIIICLAIVLPITLKKDRASTYFTLDELTNIIVSETEFYSRMEETDLNMANFENCEIQKYVLLCTNKNKLVGGRLEITDEAEKIYTEIVFYDLTVMSPFNLGAGHRACNINGFNIIYKTEQNLDAYMTKAKVVKQSTSYEIECLSLDDNVESFLERLFG